METEIITVYERWFQEGEDVYRMWSFDGKMWCIEWTPFKNPPWIICKLPELLTNE